MARPPRTILAGYPYHLTVRGNARQSIFKDDEDRRDFLVCLQHAATEAEFMIHAYVLMSNHVHLVGTPASADALARTMQGIGRSYVRHFNRRHARTGTLWEGRYRASLIEADRYLLACMRYVESNPVRARMVGAPRDWRWSSHRHNTGERVDSLVSAHSVYWGLGNTPFDREQAYRRLFDSGWKEAVQAAVDAGSGEPMGEILAVGHEGEGGLEAVEDGRVDMAGIDAVMAAMIRGHAAADDDWLEKLERQHGLRLRRGRRGRPPRIAPPLANERDPERD